MSAFNCQVAITAVGGLKEQELTVGRVFNLTCVGPWPAFKEGASLRAELLPEETYALKILSARKAAADTIELSVTSYKTGKVAIQNLIVSDGAGAKAELGPQNFEVVSVLDPSQKQEAYGPIGPLSLEIPAAWFVAAGVAVAIVLVAIGIFLRHRLQKKRLRQTLREHDSALSPLAELHQRWRRLQRSSEVYSGGSASPEEIHTVTTDLEKGFRVFLLRRFEIPFEWSDRLVVREVRRETGEANAVRDLRRLLKEFASARTSEAQGRDAVQLTEESRRLAETLDKVGPS